MKHFKLLTRITVLLVLFFLMFPQTAYAYLDLGSGSYILQIAIAALLGGLFAIKIYWSKIKAFFTNLSSKRQKDEKDAD